MPPARFGGNRWRGRTFASTGEKDDAFRPAWKLLLAHSRIRSGYVMTEPALTDGAHRPKPGPSVPAPEVCVLRPLLDRRATETPDKVFAKFPDGTFWTYRTMRDITMKTAAALQALGVRQGDHVLSWLPNGGDALRVWFGLNYIGAVYVPINLAYKGSLLQHVVRNSAARLMVAHGDL